MGNGGFRAPCVALGTALTLCGAVLKEMSAWCSLYKKVVNYTNYLSLAS